MVAGSQGAKLRLKYIMVTDAGNPRGAVCHFQL
jgi:hypothetical protein